MSMEKWNELAEDIKEGICTFAIITASGYPSELVKVVWSPVGNSEKPTLPRVVVTILDYVCVPGLGSSWTGNPNSVEDKNKARARLLAASEVWNSLTTEERNSVVGASWARQNAINLLNGISLSRIKKGMLE